MQKTLISRMSKNRILWASLLVAVLSYIAIWATYGRNALFSISVSPNDSSVVLLIATLLPYLVCIGIVSVVGYMLLRRKVAVVAAIITAFFIASISHLTVLTEGARTVLLTCFSVIAGAALFYGCYTLLIRVRRPRLMSIVFLVASILLWAVISITALYFARMR